MREPTSSIMTALSEYCKPTDAIMRLQGYANDIDKLAARYGSTELECRVMARPLGVSNEIEVILLKTRGLLIRRVNGRQVCDCRDFRRWVNQTCEQISRRPDREPPRRFGGRQQTLF